MYIQPAEPAQGYPSRRHAEKDHGPGQDADGLPEGLIRGRIVALLDDGQVRVNIAGRMLQFMPPRPMMPGEFIQMKVAARTPQLILQIADAAGESIANLSTTAALIGKLSTPGAPRPGMIMAAGTLLASPPVDARAVAAQLARVVADSGLFYESHQAEWVEGGRTLAQLAAEPQFLLRRLPVAAAPPAETALRGSAMAAGTPAGLSAALDVHPEALLLVRSQIDALDSRRLLWSGELWPGQQAQWEIIDGDEQPQQQPGKDCSAGSVWTTRISLDLPRLGPVSAVLEFRGDAAKIRIAASVPGSAAVFELEAAELRSTLAAADVTVGELAVQQYPAADVHAGSCPA